MNADIVNALTILSNWAPEQGKPFDWLPDYNLQNGRLWVSSIPEHLRTFETELAIGYAESKWASRWWSEYVEKYLNSIQN